MDSTFIEDIGYITSRYDQYERSINGKCCKNGEHLFLLRASVAYVTQTKLRESASKIYKWYRLLSPTTTFIRGVKYNWMIDPCGRKSGGSSGGGSSKHKLTFRPYIPPPKKSHDDKNMSLNRPMSPHLTIYAPTLPAMTSIVQRATGVILYSYALLLSTGSLILPNGVETYVSMIQSLDLSRPLIFIVKIILGAPFVYHYFNGVRFCMWNAGKWLAIKDVYATARKSFIATAVVTVLFAFL